MKKPLFRFVWYAILVNLTAATLNFGVAAFQPPVGNGVDWCGASEYQPHDPSYTQTSTDVTPELCRI